MKTFVRVWLAISLLAIGFGIGILVICAASGVSFKDVPTYSMEEDYDGVKAVDMQVKFGEIHIIEGDTFHIEGKDIPKDSLKAYVDDDGTWIIREDPDRFLSVFGIHISVSQLFWWIDDYKPTVTITLPKDFVADNFKFDIGAGTADAQTIRSRMGKFSVGAGELSIDRLVLNEASDFSVGAGKMTINSINADNIDVDCGVGEISMKGTVAGDNKIECGVGHIEMYLDGNSEDYTYSVESGIGSIRIGDKSFHSIGNKKIMNENAENSLNLECGIGNITIEFKALPENDF